MKPELQFAGPPKGPPCAASPSALTLRTGALRPAVAAFEVGRGPYGPRPHWGKLLSAGWPEVGARYERRSDFLDLVGRLDPRHVFRNDWFETHVIPR